MPDSPTEEKGCKDCKHCVMRLGRELIFCKLMNRHNGYKYAFTAPCAEYELKALS